jgi:hypothetical protein
MQCCFFSDFEAEPRYPKQNARFLDISFRGICTDAKGKQHPIEKVIIRRKLSTKQRHYIYEILEYVEAIIRMKKEVSDATGLTFFRIGNVQLYERDRNKLNLIIIPVSIGFIVFLAVLTFCLRRMRFVKSPISILNKMYCLFLIAEFDKNVVILSQNYRRKKKLVSRKR